MRTHAPVDTALLHALAEVVGPSYVLSRPADTQPYGRDETQGLAGRPEVVVRPSSTAEVTAVLALATAAGVPTTARAGGTGLSGGAVPVAGGIVLSVDRTDAILEIDETNLCCVVQPGVVTETLQTALEARGLYYPPDPASRGSCCIGGNIAENAGGPHCVKYGVTRDWVLALEAVTAQGEVFRTGGKLRKDVAGYDLTHLLVGSEGTLAVTTEATLRLIPFPPGRRLLLAPFPDLEGAARAVPLLYRARVVPAVLEVVGRAALDLAAAHLGRPVPGGAQAAQWILELDGDDDDALDRAAERVGAVLLDAGATDVLLADTPAREREIWAHRRCLGEAVKKSAAHVECDVAVPPGEAPKLFAAAAETAGAHGVREISYGHAGDGNIHVNLLDDTDDVRARSGRLAGAAAALFHRAAALGGTITGEHGVGCVQSRYLELCRDPVALAWMRAIKQALDPRGLLNPGKILEEPDEGPDRPWRPGDPAAHPA